MNTEYKAALSALSEKIRDNAALSTLPTWFHDSKARMFSHASALYGPLYVDSSTYGEFRFTNFEAMRRRHAGIPAEIVRQCFDAGIVYRMSPTRDHNHTRFYWLILDDGMPVMRGSIVIDGPAKTAIQIVSPVSKRA